MGMAHLQGQLGLQSNPQLAMQLLQRAAVQATVEVPQPSYVYALLLLGDFPNISLSPALIQSLLPPPPPGQIIDPAFRVLVEARKYVERAAYLNFSPAQFKLGHSYEFATPPFGFDPLMSVQYYSLASQNGEVEADMALSKWFLCGSPGGAEAGSGFDKDEGLAVVFAEKAAKRALPSAEFAMGYYSEVGVGGIGPDIDKAKWWYEKAARGGSEEAIGRLRELNSAGGHGRTLGRKEHEGLTEDKLMRKRTMAIQRAQESGAGVGGAGGNMHAPVANHDPQQQHQPHQHGGGGGGAGAGGLQVPNPDAVLRPTQADAVGLARQASKIQHPTTSAAGAPASKWKRGHRTGNSNDLTKTAVQNSAHGKGFTLSDDGPASSNTPSITVSTTPGPGSSTSSLAPNSAGSGKGPASFADMGYHSTKLEDDKCIIM